MEGVYNYPQIQTHLNSDELLDQLIDDYIKCELTADKNCSSTWNELVLPVFVQNLMLTPKNDESLEIASLSSLYAPSTIFGTKKTFNNLTNTLDDEVKISNWLHDLTLIKFLNTQLMDAWRKPHLLDADSSSSSNGNELNIFIYTKPILSSK